ncbi:MAG: iron-sulfur cluster assembly scaffold protein [Chloroflexi bacterium]|nr:iron-sulfur cluster assembly scaffold protein [Chloroflexota bacterium]
MDRQAQIEYLLDHYQNPRNRGEMPDASAQLQGGHEGCSDIVTMYIKVEGDKLARVTFTGEGCTISQASASIMTELAQGKTLAEIEALDHAIIEEEMGREVVTTRPRCATLSLDVLKLAVKQYRDKLRMTA